MFGFEPDEAKVLGSEGRYAKRIEKFRIRGYKHPRLVHYAWWALHNFVAHGMLAVWPCRFTFRFHDWTSVKLNAGLGSLREFNSKKDMEEFIRNQGK